MKCVLLLAALALAGCAHEPRVVQQRFAVPVACQEQIPDRPAMPTDALTTDSVDSYVQAAEAEIDLREGYEGKLRTALEACTKPITQ